MRVFIVGGSGGIGAAVARSLAKPGTQLLVHGGHNREKLDGLLAELRATGAEAEGFISEAADPERFLNFLPQSFEPDVLVCAFGPMVSATIAETTPHDWSWIVLSNLALPGVLLSRFGPGMAQRDFGRIVLFGGTGTDQIRGFKQVAAYSAAKTALGVLAKSAAKEWGSRNVTCNVLCPGYVATEYTKTEEKLEAERRMPRRKAMTTKEIADIAKNIVDDLSGAINGAIISCDTGI